jgi:hypothetical protein
VPKSVHHSAPAIVQQQFDDLGKSHSGVNRQVKNPFVFIT